MSLPIYDPENGPLEGLLLLEASAGTGKTYALERMVTRLVGRDSNPLKIDEILVVTFTNRAAREMKERIRGLLSDRANEDVRPEAERARCAGLALADFDKAPIYTIHGFCQTVLGTWPFECSAPFKQELITGGVLEQAEARSWIAGLRPSDIDGEVFRTAYRKAKGLDALVGGITSSLIQDEFPPGADVRPSDAESAAFAAFADSSAEPDSALSKASDALFNPDWSAEALGEFINEGIGKKKQEGTLNVIKERLCSCRGIRGIARLSEILYENDSHVSDFLKAAEQCLAAPPAGLSGEAAALAAAAADLMSAMAPYAEAAESFVERYMQCSFHDFAKKEVSERVENLKNRSGEWSYADLINRVVEAVAEPGSSLKRLLRGRYRAALIDEFQDTDPLQWGLFRDIFHTSDYFLCLIGDPKQSIYGFRGTDLRAYSDARDVVPQAGLFRLGTNYRSKPPLVSLVNRLFSPVFSRSSDGSRTLGFTPVAAGKTKNDELLWHDHAPLTLLDIPGDKVEEVKSSASAAIVSEIRRILDPDSGARWRRADDGSEEPVRPSDIAVLTRGRDDEEMLLESLLCAGIPAQRIRSLSVLDRPEAEIAAVLMEAFEEPHNIARWRSVLLGDCFRVPPDLLKKFEDAGRLDAFVERGGQWRLLFRDGRSAEVFDDFFRFARHMGDWAAEEGRSDQSRRLGRPWEHRLLTSPGGLRSWNDWRHILELIQANQAAGMNDIHSLVRRLRRDGSSGDPEGREDAVRLASEEPSVRVMTMHTAKGLEFPLVFLHGGYKSNRVAPSENPYRFEENGRLVIDRLHRKENKLKNLAYEWEEEKRLWYVAFTRASTKIWLPRPTMSGSVLAVESFLDAAAAEEMSGGKAAENSASGIADSAAESGITADSQAFGAAGWTEDAGWEVAASGGTGQSSPGSAAAAPSAGRLSLPPHLTVTARKDVPVFREKLSAKLENLAADPESGVSLAIGDISPPPSLPVSPTAPPKAAPLPPGPCGDRDPQTNSYTSLVRLLHDSEDGAAAPGAGIAGKGELRDRDVDAADEDVGAMPTEGAGTYGAAVNAVGADAADSGTILSADEAVGINKEETVPLPEDRGALFGTLIHALFEECDFQAAAGDESAWFEDKKRDRLFEEISRRYYPPEWYRYRSQPLKALVRSVLRCSIPGIGRLCDIDARFRRAEVEFLMSVPRDANLPVADQKLFLKNGYLKGFIDLLIRTGDSWWVLDWKTNLPMGSLSVDAYDGSGCAALMEHHHYRLQSEIYLLALCRTLSARRGGAIDWENEIGGAAYLFVRGMREGDSQGVDVNKPELERMLSLASSMGLEGVIS